MDTLGHLELNKTALVTIDLQRGILTGHHFQPHAGDKTLKASNDIAEALKNTAVLIALVNVNPSTIGYLRPFEGGRQGLKRFPDDYSQLLMTIANDETSHNVIKVTKHNPGAFFGTDLDLQLRRRGIDTIILTGVVTSNGIYATALDAFQYGYKVIVVEDACTDRDPQLHEIFFDKLLPKIALVSSEELILEEIKEAY
ncbi:isochorismatase family protein [Lentilactobacillus hilgardii]|uniref:isochorismatase family protein n=1 Tax=Lentilactobacillus hilgardii TaxID=1588 RepID=UPI003FA550BB